MDCAVSTDLLRHIARKLTGEWQDVGRNLGLNEEHIFSVRANNPGNIDEAKYQLLIKWKQLLGEKATVGKLCEALQESERRDLVVAACHFQPKQEEWRLGEHKDYRDDTRDVTHDKSVMLIEGLRKKYRTICSMMRPIPWKKDLKLNIKDMFVDVGISHLNKAEDSRDERSWKPKQSIKALFTDENLTMATRVVIEGGPGCGKTTLLLQLAYLWCEELDPMKSVFIFILLPLKHVKVGESMYKAIKDQLLPKDTSLTEMDIESVLTTKTHIVLALDGLDECPARSDDAFEDSEIMASLRGDMLHQVRNIVSTRSSCLSDLIDFDIERVRLQKFESQHWLMYFEKTTLTDERAGLSEAIMKVIKEQQILQRLCEIPLFLALLTQIIREDVSRHSLKFESVTEVFKHIITCMEAHHDNKRVTKSRKMEAILFNEKAFNGLMTQTKTQTWDKKELKQVPGYQRMVESGILIEEEGQVIVESYMCDVDLNPITTRFMHQLFQEWFGARFLAQIFDTEDRFLAALEAITTKELPYLLQFTCGLNPHATKPILEQLLMLDDLETFCLCFTEHTGDKSPIRDVVAERCHSGFMLTRAEAMDTASIKAELKMLKYISENEIPVPQLTVDAYRVKGDKMIIAPGVSLEPILTVQVIKLWEWPGDDTAKWLKQCRSLKQLEITSSGGRPLRANLLSKAIDETKIKVLVQEGCRASGLISYHYGLRQGKWEKTHDMNCDSCDSNEILGIRYQCMDCDMYDLCGSCILKKDHLQHQFRQISGKLRPFDTACGCEENLICHCCTEGGSIGNLTFGEFYGIERYRCIVCCSCGCELMETVYYRCKSCRHYVICDSCRLNGIHNEHEFIRRDREEVDMHYSVQCDICKEGPLEGKRYRCLTCKSFDLCECCKERGEHNEHDLVMYTGNLLHDVICDGCQEYVFKGRRLKCTTCSDFNLCERCINTNIPLKHSKDHELKEVIEQEVSQPRVNCNGCGELPLVGRRFNCKTCVLYNLCEQCLSNGFHPQHHFKVYEVKDSLKIENCHRGISCNGCNRTNMGGNRYRCKSCLWYNICESCNSRRLHPGHGLRKFDGTEVKHTFIQCNICKELPIIGDRYNCQTCPWFNVCENCKVNDTYRFHYDHQFQKISENKHTFVECNRCNEIPIIGTRYKCRTCPAFNLCKSCKDNNFHDDHDFEKNKRDQQIFIICRICNEVPTNGLWYKCKICPDYDLCKSCRYSELHYEHELEFEKITVEKQNLVECKLCEEIPIIGVWYSCKTCPNFNLCDSCKKCTDYHEHSEFTEITKFKHSSVKCDGCDELPIAGVRYQCKTCKWFNLCGKCRKSKYLKIHKDHADHEFETFPKEEHQGVQCCICLEQPIRGSRYQCQECLSFNLCESCKDNEYHEGHHFDEIHNNGS